VRTQGRAIQLNDHEVIVIEPAPDQQQLLSLSYAMGAVLSDKRRRQSDRATAAALGFLVPDAGFCLLGGLGNRKLRRREVNISPPERSDLAPPQPAKHRQHGRHEHAIATGSLDHFGRLNMAPSAAGVFSRPHALAKFT
jgi:hypothetical protein